MKMYTLKTPNEQFINTPCLRWKRMTFTKKESNAVGWTDFNTVVKTMNRLNNRVSKPNLRVVEIEVGVQA